MTHSDIYTIQLHEQIDLMEAKPTWKITRVPGGWIYTCPQGQGHSVFVPYDNQFYTPY